MFKPASMQKIQVLLPRTMLPAAIATLHGFGAMEITSADYAGLEKGKPLETYDRIAEQLVRLRAIRQALGTGPVNIERMDGKTAMAGAEALSIDQELRLLTEKKEALRSRQNALKEQLRLVQILQGFGPIDFSSLRTSTLDYLVVRGETKPMHQLESALAEKLQAYEILRAPLHERETLLLVIYRRGQPIEEALGTLAIQKVDIPPSLGVPADALHTLQQELKACDGELEQIGHRRQQLSHTYSSQVASLEKALTIEADRAEIAFRFQFTERVAVITGWIKSADMEKIQHALVRTHESIVVQRIQSDAHDLPPTLMENPRVAHPFEFITGQFSLPNAREIDPTLIYLITIPILYGMIVGDVLYGIASYLIAGWIGRKFRKSPILSNVAQIWKLSALPSILFGLLFDEWAGLSHVRLLQTLAAWGLPIIVRGPVYAPFVERVENLSGLIVLTLVAGLIHLAIGFLLGAINQWHHNKKHAIAKLAWILVEISGTLAVTSLFFAMFPPSVGMAGVIGVVVGAVILFFTEGIVGILELPGFAGNVLSYVRIAAIGVVGVLLAEIINQSFLPLPQQGLLALVFFPLFILLHAVNAFIAMFESIIQGGRLNIIEFRSKFLIGGGKPFEPFRYSYE